MTKGADDQYSTTIPASAYEAGEMVRWYLIATTTSGESTREPPFPDLTESAQYFGTVISDPSISVEPTGHALVCQKYRSSRHAWRDPRVPLF
jgi:hypothetical protein